MALSVRMRVVKLRAARRAAGLRPVQIWVPDPKLPGFADECRRQSLIVAAADQQDDDLSRSLDAAMLDVTAGNHDSE